jgi:hypothetical protein
MRPMSGWIAGAALGPSLSLVAALSAPAFAQSTAFTFDPTGTPGPAGDITGLAAIDQSRGNTGGHYFTFVAGFGDWLSHRS